jgi:hypothetical protein
MNRLWQLATLARYDAASLSRAGQRNEAGSPDIALGKLNEPARAPREVRGLVSPVGIEPTTY